MNKNDATLRRMTEKERAEYAGRPCGEDKKATQIPYDENRCRKPVTWLWSNNGGHTQSGNSTFTRNIVVRRPRSETILKLRGFRQGKRLKLKQFPARCSGNF